MLNNIKKLFMLENYLPVLIFVMVSLVLGSVLLAIGFVLAPHKPDIKKTPLLNAVLKRLKIAI